MPRATPGAAGQRAKPSLSARLGDWLRDTAPAPRAGSEHGGRGASPLAAAASPAEGAGSRKRSAGAAPRSRGFGFFSLLGLVLLCGALGMTRDILGSVYTAARLGIARQIAPGRVASVDRRGNGVSYTFQVAAGEREVSYRGWQPITMEDEYTLSRGEEILVEYVPENPTISRIRGVPSINLGTFFCTVPFIIGLAALAVFFVRSGGGPAGAAPPSSQ